ncbi:AMP-binding protein [Planctomycetota bacterium]
MDHQAPPGNNIARYLPYRAEHFPMRPAVIVQKPDGSWPGYNFAELNNCSDSYAHGLLGMGMERGMKVLVMVRPGLEFIAIAFALFKAGLVPVLIDPGMGIRNMLGCIQQIKPEGFIGIPKAHFMRLLYRIYFKSVKFQVTVGRKWFWGGGRPWMVSAGFGISLLLL